MCFVTLGHFWHFSVFLDIMTNTLAGKDDCKHIIVRILGRHLKILWSLMCVRIASAFLQSFFFFFLVILAKFLVFKLRLYTLYVLQPFWTTIWWTMYSGEIINTDCHFWFRKRSVLRSLETDLTHGLIVVYIYIYILSIWGSLDQKKIKIMLSPIFQVTWKKKHAHVQVPIYLQIKCRCN